MYNQEQKQSQAWFAMEQIIDAAKVVDSATGDMEEAARGAVDTIGELEGELEEVQEERDQYERDLDEIKGKLYSYDPIDVINLLDRLESAAAAIANYAANTKADVRKTYEIKDPDSGTGDSSDDRAEIADDSFDGQATTERVEGS